MQQKTIFVGLSGGVDSAVSAHKLLAAGHSVVGVFIRVWHPDFLTCNWEAERRDAMRVAATLKIPFFTVDAREAYKQEVADAFIAEYKAGRTPNPDVLCNKSVKFGVFLRYALSHKADAIATGHYARIEEASSGEYTLYRGKDKTKDQSYFLWMLDRYALAHTYFPLGDTNKETVRKEAAARGLPIAEKPDSQGICFLGHVDIPDFLSHYTTLKEGAVLDPHDNTIGVHKGALVYTTGQRHGFHITAPTEAGKTHYVIDRDITANTITVDTHPPRAEKGSEITLQNTNWIGTPPHIGAELAVVFRYRETPHRAILKRRDRDTATLTLTDAGEPATTGQSCVCYLGDRCCGGGIISA